mgnify:FL=1
MRLGLIKDNIELPLQDGFLLCDETGTEQVRLLAFISRGGSCLAYRGVRSRNGRNFACIVKEYFPKEAYEDGIYIRDNVGDDIKILPEYREKELQIQKENVERELAMNQNIYFNPGEDQSNNPYAFQLERLCTKKGDTSYLIIDTDEGGTLYSTMEKSLCPEDCLKYIYQLLVIVRHLSKKGYIHGDIKPENIYVRGQGANANLCLLDFGSVVPLREYQKDLSQLSVKEIFASADQIILNTTLGSTTREYGSMGLLAIRNHKRLYKSADPSFERAQALIEAVNQLSVKDDLYSVVKITEELFEKADMDQEQRASIKDTLADIRLKNQNTGYQSVEELRGDIEILETILHNGAHPAVLIKNMAESGIFDLPDDFDEELLCEVCEAE